MTTTNHTPSPLIVVEAQHRYVEASVREHWLRKDLLRARSARWRATGSGRDQADDDLKKVEWLHAEAEHAMVTWRMALHAQGVRAI